MKNIVRASVLAVLATGTIATAAFASTNNSAKITLAPRASAMPIPPCPPDDPQGCGIGSINH